jgi:protein gp37
MGDTTGIGWTDRTFNPWWGCSRVSPGCRSCYADTLARRWGHDLWHRDGPRRLLGGASWAKPLRWNREAAAAGVPARVFCASMADVFEDHPQVVGARARLWDLIGQTPWLRWQLLTKRIENVPQMVPWGDRWPANVWLGTSVENGHYAAERIPVLASIPAPGPVPVLRAAAVRDRPQRLAAGSQLGHHRRRVRRETARDGPGVADLDRQPVPARRRAGVR